MGGGEEGHSYLQKSVTITLQRIKVLLTSMSLVSKFNLPWRSDNWKEPVPFTTLRNTTVASTAPAESEVASEISGETAQQMYGPHVLY